MEKTTTSNFSPGDLIEFFEQKRILIAYVVQVKKDKLLVLAETSREINLPFGRIIHCTSQVFHDSISRGEILLKMREISSYRANLAKEFDLSNIWKTIESGGVTLDFTDFMVLVLGKVPSADQASAMIRAINLTRNYFEVDGAQLRIYTEEQVDEIQRKILRAEIREKEKEVLVKWLQEAIHNKASLEKPVQADRLTAAMKLLAANVEDVHDKTWTKEILKRVNLTTADSIFQHLVKMKILDPDENLDLIRYPQYSLFSNESFQQEAAIRISHPSPDSDRLDLRDLSVFTIDSAETKDMDDALSCEMKSGDSYQVGIHITDIASLIEPGTPLDMDARARAQTLYMPDRIIPMLSDTFTYSQGSLIAGEDRAAVSILVDFSPRHYVTDYRIVPSIIKVRNRLTYDQTDAAIHEDPLRQLYQTARMLRAERVRSGAIIMPRPELDIKLDASKVITLKRRDREAPSQILVSELMILANRLAAEFAQKNNIPFPYRIQDPPSDTVPQSKESFDPLIAYRQRRAMNRAMSSIEPKPHFSLAIPCYTNLTSPLRRYFDLIAQRQLESFILCQQMMTKEQLSLLLFEIDTSVSKSNMIITNREYFWLLRYLSSMKGQQLDAVVLDRFPYRYQVWLSDYLIDADIPIPFGRDLTPGEKIRVIIERVSPVERTLKLRLVD